MSLQELVMSLDYYELLDITMDCEKDKIKSAYEEALKTYSLQNQDTQIIFSKQEAELILKMIEEAYKVLSDENLKKIYDRLSVAGLADQSQLSIEALTHIYNSELEIKKRTEKPSYEKDETKEAEFRLKTAWSGQDIKSYREYKNISIDYLNYKTKINSWYIKALEEMDLKQLPAPVFVRGYVLQVAKELGLNEKLVTESYMSLLLKTKHVGK